MKITKNSITFIKVFLINNNDIMNLRDNIIKIIYNNSPELAVEEIMLLLGINGQKCKFCGSIEVVESKDYDMKGRYFCKHCNFEQS